MGRKIYFDDQFGLQSYALVDEGELCDCSLEHAADGAVIGNVYKGRVTDVLNGMQAAFVDCGLERHCYISVDDMRADGKRVDGGEIDIPSTLNLHEGDEILVQVIKAGQGKKGAKVTTNLSFVGKYIVFYPTTPFIGVSAKISDAELRKNLMYSARKVVAEGEGIIVRTAAPYALLSVKVNEIEYYRKIYKNILERFDSAAVGELLYSDSPLHIRILRDLMLNAGDEIHVGSKALYESVKEIISSYSGGEYIQVILHDDHTDMMYTEGIGEQFMKSMQPKIELKNGAYLVIDRTEALTVIDVNTGKFTGDDSLEQTVYYTNVLATREIARQVKLRNLGGLFVVDFIDMNEENHRKAIVVELEKALHDKGRCKVLPMSKFGLVEFTRKRTGSPTDDITLKPCKTCGGSGVIRSHEGLLCEFRARLLEMLARGASIVFADLNFDLANTLLSHDAIKKNIAELYPQARVYIISHRTYREDNMYFREIVSPVFSIPDGAVLLY